ncbi:DLA class I histocompatibility antigen, A9/A9 alpha chain-like isoform X2 [Megalobrama amblycephala]|uniref:DLA class I histocompatibility antigen, A9/A9 alpha chain-like isoform X2 n=1 Tax=Megalobrama amblycephala TaxID=75352 RepID=UPI002014474E|nr:DLA class I histocompatibility antigen, A9/A9 alpha chain-like isoform X2 [Megalobrama amblycephala]
MIRSVRKIMNSILRGQSIDKEGLHMHLCEVESVINGRPITRSSMGPNDLEALTPNHLLLLKTQPSFPPGLFQKEDIYVRRRWRQVQYMADLFWRRWLKEYLPQLQERQKWLVKRRNFQVGDVVLIVNDAATRIAWIMVSPQVSLLQKNSSSPVLCHITHFYPSNITITWMRNGQELKNVKVGNLLPNEDGTFQKTVTLQTEADEWRKNEFSCVVKHQSKTFRKTLTEKEIRTNNETSAPVDMTVVVVPVVILLSLLLIIAVIGYLVYQRKLKSGYVPAKPSPSEYESSVQSSTEA